jgi:hypothetical protein
VDVSAASKFDNQWHLVTCVRDITAKKLRVYLDGEFAKETTDNTTSIGEASDFIIGNRNVNFDNPYTGSLDDLRIYKSALSAAEIYALYKSAPIFTGIEETIKEIPYKAYISNNILSVESQNTEMVEIYSIHGLKLFSGNKDAGYTEFRIPDIGKGIIIIKGSSGWSNKAIVF